jgi:hypothetical protein
MKLTYFTSDFLISVRDIAAREHRVRYSENDPWVFSLAGASSGIRESMIEVSELPELISDSDSRTEHDAANSISLFEQLRMLTPVQATDERLWACLAHTYYWRYSCIRWRGGTAEKFESVEKHWFLPGSSMERLARNSIARLWWGAYATVVDDAIDPYKLTRILFSNTDIQQSYMERLFCKNRVVMHTALEFTQRNAGRIRYRKSLGDWAKETGKLLNRVGGVLQLDAFTSDDVEELLENYLCSLYKA